MDQPRDREEHVAVAGAERDEDTAHVGRYSPLPPPRIKRAAAGPASGITASEIAKPTTIGSACFKIKNSRISVAMMSTPTAATKSRAVQAPNLSGSIVTLHRHPIFVRLTPRSRA